MSAEVLLRDIHQLRDAPAFGVTAIEGLLTAENMLYEALRYVPYCNDHLAVWSSHFTQIILDAASQVDSVWKATAKIVAPSTATEKSSLNKHYKRFGSLVAKQLVVFFGGESPCTIHPFQQWQIPPFSSPPWWDAYNKLKHDRFSNQREATLEHAINAVAALFLAIVYSGTCDLALISGNLVDPSQRNPWAFTSTGLLRDVTFHCQAKIEAKLFAHPLGIFGVENCNLSSNWRSASIRFNIWWAINCVNYTRNK